jgi:hypothetical protein
MRKIIGERQRATIFKGVEADEEKICAAKAFGDRLESIPAVSATYFLL